ncbi:MAG: hypothetical protein AB9869_09780 [Verrucomicrobiia bacterium]
MNVPGKRAQDRHTWFWTTGSSFRSLVWARAATVLSACVLGFSVFAAQSAPPEAPDFEGTWHWSFTMPGGTTSQPKLVLESDDGRLTGTTSFRPGSEAAITNVVVRGNQLRFQVVRSRGDQQVVTTYAGTLTGRIIRGTVESNWAGEKRVYPWEARRTHDGAGGYWNWTIDVRGRKTENRIRLAQRGDQLTGYIPGTERGGRLVRISRGSGKDGDIYFEIERGTGEKKVLSIYQGKQTGDRIKGTITTIVGETKQDAPWNAVRSR